MKKIFSLIMAITMLMCAVGFVPISVQASEYTYGELNEFEVKYNISYDSTGGLNERTMKVQSVDELNELPYAESRFKQYDEEFFKHRFLIMLSAYGDGDDNFRVISVTEDEGTFGIDVDCMISELGPTVVRHWLILLEVDRAHLNKELSVRWLEDLAGAPDYEPPQYYAGGIGIDYHALDPQSKPYWVRVDSEEMLEQYTGIGATEIIDNYISYFEYGWQLLFIQWVEPIDGRTREVVSAYYDMDDEESPITVKLSSFNPEGEYPTVVTPYCAVIEIPPRVTDREIVLEYEYDYGNMLEISTAEGLKAFADSVNNGNTYEGKTVTLTADIDLSSVCGATMGETDMTISWTPIGSFDNPFNGTFDGAGHTISGLYINSDYTDLTGLFGYCDEKSQILNLVVDGSITVGTPSSGNWAQPSFFIGGIAAASVGKIARCHNKTAITTFGNGAFTAGICGMGVYAVIEKCINTGVIAGETGSCAIVALGSDCVIYACYYLKDTASDDSGAQAKTAEQFASGEVAYLLREPWGQNIGVDKYPVIGGDKVYYINGEYTNAPKRVVTVEPPTVNIESGEVPYGTKVTISPTNSNDFVYFVNGEQFINSRLTQGVLTDAVITITEDTVLVVKSMIDVIEPDTEYVFSEATYTYTIGGSVVPAEYPYNINSLKLVSESGEEYDTPPADKSFIVDVDITKTSARNSKDYFIVAAYDTNGALISMNYIKADLSAGSDFSFGVNIPKSDKTIGSIKAFVWDSLGGMTPLAESKFIVCSTIVNKILFITDCPRAVCFFIKTQFRHHA